MQLVLDSAVAEPWHGTHGGYTNRKCRCAECSAAANRYRREYQRRRKTADPLYRVGRNIRLRHGLAYEDYLERRRQSRGLCAICGSEPKPNDLCLDHDHVSGALRQFLCRLCNSGLGHFGDSPERLRAAADYVEAHR